MSILGYKGYQGRFEYDPDADIFHGDVLHINDVITFQGRSIDELRAALAESVDVYLEYCEKKGRAPEKPFSGNFNPDISRRFCRSVGANGRGYKARAVKATKAYRTMCRGA